jgi:hypothetical protein
MHGDGLDAWILRQEYWYIGAVSSTLKTNKDQ